MKLRINDEVIIIAGKYKGKISKIQKVFPRENKVLVDGVNVVKKHVKPDPNKGIEGGVKSSPRPLDVSNVAIYNPKNKKADRIKFVFENNKKVRTFSSNGEKVDI